MIDGNHLTIFIHRLVAEVFIGPRPAGTEVNHKDGNKQNPIVTNLEYVTHLENVRHAIRIGRRRMKFSDYAIRRIRERWESGETVAEIASTFDMSPRWCRQICNMEGRL